MITFWQQENGKLIKCEDNKPTENQNTWIDVRSVTRDDIRILEDEYKIEQENILDILDQDELSRIEKEDDYTLIIVRLPIFNPENDISYFAVPVGIILFPNKIITICWTDCEVLKDIAANRIRSLSLTDFPAFIMRLLSRGDATFLRYLKEINRRSTTIQDELQRSIKNNELIQLLNLEKSLVFFTTSLRSNQLLLEKLVKTKILNLDEDDRDWLDDVQIDNRQAIEMADTYSNILSGMMDAFASVISNNLNIVMKRLTVISLIMMVPTFIVSFFGMNIPLPFMNSGWWGIGIISLTCLIAVFVARAWLLNDKPVLEPKKPRIKKAKKQRKVADKPTMTTILLTFISILMFVMPAKTSAQDIVDYGTITQTEQIVVPTTPFAANLVTVTDTADQPRFPDFIIGEQSQAFTSKRTVESFKINRFETTYSLWYSVRLWAEDNGYTFQNPGQEGSKGRRGRKPTDAGMFEPVTTINWRDAIVWCNALSELMERKPCYTYKNEVLRDSTNASAIDLAECDFSSTGYRLPTETEWEYAARKTKIGFQRGDLPSGSIKPDGTSSSLIPETDLAWTSGNTIKTKTVGTTGTTTSPYDNYTQLEIPGTGHANGQGLFDMSGNVLEFCWDWLDDYKMIPKNERPVGPEFGSERISRGGSWSPYASFILTGDRYSYDPDEAYNYMGFRFCRSLDTTDFTNPEKLANDEVILLPVK